MSIPAQGWTKALFSEPRRYILPEAYTFRYSDTFRFGAVSNVLTRARGYPEITNRSGFRLIDIQVDITSVHDVVLIDRIE